MTKFTITINKHHIWKGAYPCPNLNCSAEDKRAWSVISKSKTYWRYLCECGTEIRIPKEREEE